MNILNKLFILSILLSALAFTTPNTSETKAARSFAFTEKTAEIPALKWYQKFEEASELSMKTQKPIFAFFTGSDWCGWCMRLQSTVFAKDAFKIWADQEVILLELDFPRRKELPEDIKQQNYELASIFQVRGYPTVWIFNTTFNATTQKLEIAPLGSTGYPSGAEVGKEEDKFIEDANAILNNK